MVFEGGRQASLAMAPNFQHKQTTWDRAWQRAQGASTAA
jgi:hypothetical protein